MNKQELARVTVNQRAKEKSILLRAITTRRVLVQGDLNEEVQGGFDPRFADVTNELRFGFRLLLRLPFRGREQGIASMSFADLLYKMIEINKEKKTAEVTIFDRNGQIVEK